MMNELLQLDQIVFHFINHDLHHPVLDAIMPYWRSKYTWIPFYLLLGGFMVYRFQWKGLLFLLAMVSTIAIADPLSSEVVKKNIQRIRPCNDPEVKESVELLIPCGGGYSFTSSHATNHFAITVFLVLTLGTILRPLRWILPLWAATIALGQVYVGVHYPLDVIGGALLGSLIGWVVAYVYLHWERIAIPDLIAKKPV